MPIVGDVLADRYRIESVLGVGGMASVFLATDVRLDRQVAVKVLAANLSADAQFAERFNREAAAMAGFSHPNVAAVYDVEPGDPTTGRESFYVMEYCEGGSLADRLKASGRIAPADLIPIVTAVSEGLAELHRRGLIHRDVKPANILFASDRPKLADFGLAWTEGPREGDPLTLPGTTLGTMAYLAPELAAEGPPSAASDVYALGVTIFQALTGQYPQATSMAEPDSIAGSGAPLPVSAAAPDLGPRFDVVLGRALAEDPADRPSPTELAAQLVSGGELWGVARPNPGADHEPRPRPKGRSDVDMEAPTRVAPAVVASALAAGAATGGLEPAPSNPPISAPAPSGPGHPGAAEVSPMPEVPVASVRAAARRRTVSRVAPSPSGLDAYPRRVIVGIGLVILAILAVLVLPGLLGANGQLPGASRSPSPKASATAAASRSASPVPSGLQAMVAAVDRVDAAIEATRGGKDGLSGKDGNELTQLSASVRNALHRGDVSAAASAAGSLSDRADELAKDLDKHRREALLSAIDALVSALSRH